MPRVTVKGDLTIGGVGSLPAGASEIDPERLAAFMAHPLFAEDVARGRVLVEDEGPDEPEPTKRGRKLS